MNFSELNSVLIGIKKSFYMESKEKEGCSFLNPPLQIEYAHKGA